MPATQHPRRPRTNLLALAAAAILALLAPVAASAESVTASYPVPTADDPNAAATVTISEGTPRPGDVIDISGTGFLRQDPANAGDEVPHVALMVDGLVLPSTPWFVSGGDALAAGTLEHGHHAMLWFKAKTDGTFAGQIRIADDFVNPPSYGGGHYFQILSGAFTSETGADGSSDASRPGGTKPISFQVPFAVDPRVTLGTVDTGGTFAPSRQFAPGATVALRLAEDTPNGTVSATFRGQPLTLTEVAGSPRELRTTVPADAASGEAELRVTFPRAGGGEPRVEPHRVTIAAPAPPVGAPPLETTPGGTTPITSPSGPPTKPAPLVAPKLTAFKVLKGRTLRLTLAGTTGRKVAVTVKSTRKIRITKRSRAKVVTFVRTRTTTRTGAVSLTLTSDGRKALKRLKKVSAVVTLKPSGGTAVAKTITLRR